MTHDELLDAINKQIITAPPFALGGYTKFLQGLSAVVELHIETKDGYCGWCYLCNYERTGLYMDSAMYAYPCPTIQAVEKELS